MAGYWAPSAVGIDPADYAAGQVPVKDAGTGLFVAGEASGGASGELLVQDGSSSPPVMLTLEDGTDFLYEDI